MKPDKKTILGNTIIHGDFHPFNLFFDEIGGHFTFIDNESMSRSLYDPVSPSADIIELFIVPFTTNPEYQPFRDLIKGVNVKTWWEHNIEKFSSRLFRAIQNNRTHASVTRNKKMFADFNIPWADFDQQKTKKSERTRNKPYIR